MSGVIEALHIFDEHKYASPDPDPSFCRILTSVAMPSSPIPTRNDRSAHNTFSPSTSSTQHHGRT